MYKVYRYTRVAKIRKDVSIASYSYLGNARKFVESESDAGRANVFIQYPQSHLVAQSVVRQSRAVARS